MTDQHRVLLSTPLILVVFTLLGCSVGLVIPFMREYELGPQWRSLGKPPAMPVKLLAADFHTVSVQTSDQQISSCYRESRFDQRCWIAITVVCHPLNQAGAGLTNPTMRHHHDQCVRHADGARGRRASGSTSTAHAVEIPMQPQGRRRRVL
jgi:hypothetical protein